MSNRIIVAGSRSIGETFYPKVKEILMNYKFDELISGDCFKGVDKLGERYAKENNIDLKLFPADWKLYGKSAGYKRNVQMGEYGTELIAFWDLVSPGTQHMINIMVKMFHKPAHIYVLKHG